MLLLLLWSVLALVSAREGEREAPQMEVLFYSSDEAVPWPPEEIKSRPLPAWPGQGEQLGKFQPRRKVEVAYRAGFPSPPDFYANFVRRQRPVVFSGLEESHYDFLQLSRLNTSARAALSFSPVSSFTSGQKLTESIRNFLTDKMTGPYYLSEHLHKNLKAKTLLPGCLQCSRLVDLFVSTTHNIIGHVYPLPVKQVLTLIFESQTLTSPPSLLARMFMTFFTVKLTARGRSSWLTPHSSLTSRRSSRSMFPRTVRPASSTLCPWTMPDIRAWRGYLYFTSLSWDLVSRE